MDFNQFSIFKLPNKIRRFEYVPRYYDARKATLKRKIEMVEREHNGDSGDISRREIAFRVKAADKWGNSDYKAASMRQNFRLLVILGILVIVVYFIFIGIDGIEPIIEKFYE